MTLRLVGQIVEEEGGDPGPLPTIFSSPFPLKSEKGEIRMQYGERKLDNSQSRFSYQHVSVSTKTTPVSRHLEVFQDGLVTHTEGLMKASKTRRIDGSWLSLQ